MSESAPAASNKLEPHIPLNGFLDHLKSNLQVLDEQIELARGMSKSKNGLQWAKNLRDLIELRNTTLDKIKAHLLGRDETGTIKEPPSVYDDNHPQTMFERYFHGLSEPMSLEDLKLKCEKCETESEGTQSRYFERYQVDKGYYDVIQYKRQDLCDGCYNATLQELYAAVKAAREKNGWNTK